MKYTYSHIFRLLLGAGLSIKEADRLARECARG